MVMVFVGLTQENKLWLTHELCNLQAEGTVNIKTDDWVGCGGGAYLSHHAVQKPLHELHHTLQQNTT